MNDFEVIIKPILAKNLPTKEDKDKIGKNVNKVIDTVEFNIKKNKIKATVKIGGSFAKGTFLKNDHDCDVFVRFDYSYREENISDLTATILKGLHAKRVHGSRDYFQFEKYGISFEFVPVLFVTNPKKAMNVTDCSPMHADWILAKISKQKTLPREIVLAKLFTKAIGVYGAESYINGFSGHVLDIMVSYYGNFVKLLEASLSWNKGDIINIEKHNAKMNDSKKYGPLIVVDPIQPDRNAAAALGLDKYNIFKKKAKDFLDNPNGSFFVKPKFDLQGVKKKNSIVLKVVPVSGKDDIVGCKLLKVYTMIKRELKDFGVTSSDWYWDKKKKSYFWFKIKNEKLPASFVRDGPPVNSKENYKKFISKYSDTFVKKGKVYANVKRKYKEVDKFVKILINENAFGERIKKIEIA